MTEKQNSKTLVIDLHYAPSISYILSLIASSKTCFEQFEHHEKGSCRNRCYLAGPDGPIRLTVPLEKGKHQHSLIKEVRVCNSYPWQKLHWRTLESAYRKSPWFEFYEESLRPVYEKPWDYLMDLNLELLGRITGWLDLDFKPGFTEEFQPVYDPAEFVDLRNRFLPGDFNPDQDPGGPKYHQVFEERTGFIPGLSILDLLFAEGKRSAGILTGYAGGSL